MATRTRRSANSSAMRGTGQFSAHFPSSAPMGSSLKRSHHNRHRIAGRQAAAGAVRMPARCGRPVPARGQPNSWSLQHRDHRCYRLIGRYRSSTGRSRGRQDRFQPHPLGFRQGQRRGLEPNQWCASTMPNDHLHDLSAGRRRPISDFRESGARRTPCNRRAVGGRCSFPPRRERYERFSCRTRPKPRRL